MEVYCILLLMLGFLNLPFYSQAVNNCIPRKFDQDSVVCVCNATYCDEVQQADKLGLSSFYAYTSSRDGLRFDRKVEQFVKAPASSQVYELVPNVTYQTVMGFGGAFTDAATINIMSLSQKTRDNLITAYFAPSGIEYTIGRVPMAGCDFSTHVYSYDDFVNDTKLTKFSLAMEDVKYKIPVIQQALNVSGKKIAIFGSPWSAPAWMKTNNKMTGKGTLIGAPGGVYFEAWANYFVRFLQEYKKNGIDFWGVTAQNEPTDGLIFDFPFNCMGWTPESQRDFIAKDLGPALASNGFADIKIMILDDQRLMLPYWAEVVLNSPEAAKYVSGIAIHWYDDLFIPTIALDSTHSKFPDKFILNTEACEVPLLDKKLAVQLGKWQRAERYFSDIMQDMNHWVVGWTDWNIALDMEGGPNWEKNFVDSPVIVNSKNDEFYKQPMFYALGHFSKFVVPGSKRLHWTQLPGDMELIGFLRPDGSVVVLLGNYQDNTVTMTLRDPVLGYINYNLPAHSIHTLVWWRT